MWTNLIRDESLYFEIRCPAYAESLVLFQLIKSPYKIYFLNIPLFMRARKRFYAEKIRNIGCFPEFWAIFSEPWYCRNGCEFIDLLS